jgi:hypothetical protein
VENFGLNRNSCQADFTINDNINDNVIDAFIGDELVVIDIDTAEPTNMVGDNGTPFSGILNKNNIKKT